MSKERTILGTAEEKTSPELKTLFNNIIDLAATHLKNTSASKTSNEKTSNEKTGLGSRMVFTLNTEGNSAHPSIRRVKLIARSDIAIESDIAFHDSLLEISTDSKKKQVLRVSESDSKILLAQFIKLQNMTSKQIIAIDLLQAGKGALSWKYQKSHAEYQANTYQMYETIHAELISNAIASLKKLIKPNVPIKFNMIDGGCGANPLLFKLKAAVEKDPELSQNKLIEFKWLGFDFSPDNIVECNKLLAKANDEKQEITNMVFVEGDLTKMDELIQQQKNNKNLYADGVTVGCFSGSTTRLVLSDALQCLDALQSMAKGKMEIAVFSGWAELLFRKFQAKRIGYDSQFNAKPLNYLHPIVTLQEKSLAEQVNYYLSRLAKDPTFLDLSLHPAPVEILKELLKNKSIDFNKITDIDLSFCNINAKDSKILAELITKNFGNPNLHVTFYHHHAEAIENFPITQLLNANTQLTLRHVNNELYLMGSPNFFERLEEHIVLPQFTSTAGGIMLNAIFESLEKMEPEVRKKYKQEIDICYHIFTHPAYMTKENIMLLAIASDAGFKPATQVIQNILPYVSEYEMAKSLENTLTFNFKSIHHQFGLNALGMAIHEGKADLVGFLLEKGADCQIISNRSGWEHDNLAWDTLRLALVVRPDDMKPETRNKIINTLLEKGKWMSEDHLFDPITNEEKDVYRENKQYFIDDTVIYAIDMISDSSVLIPIINNLKNQGADLKLRNADGETPLELLQLRRVERRRGPDYVAKGMDDFILEKLLDSQTPDAVIKKLLDPSVPNGEKDKLLTPASTADDLTKPSLFSSGSTLFESQVQDVSETKKERPTPLSPKK